MLADGPRVGRLHGAAECPPLGRYDQNIVASVKLALVPLHQTFTLQAVHQPADVVLGQLCAVLHPGLAQHALRRVLHLSPVAARVALSVPDG